MGALCPTVFKSKPLLVNIVGVQDMDTGVIFPALYVYTGYLPNGPIATTWDTNP